MLSLKDYFYFSMSHICFFLGDIASKPMSWGWLDNFEENKLIEWGIHINYNIYNWLMLKSVYFNDKGPYNIWTFEPLNEDDVEDE